MTKFSGIDDFNFWLDKYTESLMPKMLVSDSLLTEFIDNCVVNNYYANIIEEHMFILLGYLLKWQFQLHSQDKNWKNIILYNRQILSETINKLDNSEELVSNKLWLQQLWDKAIIEINIETKNAIPNFYSEPIWSLEQILDNNFYPKQIWVNYFKIIS